MSNILPTGSKNKKKNIIIQLISILLVIISWIISNFIFLNNNKDVTIFLFVFIFIIALIKYKFNIYNFLLKCGLKKIKINKIILILPFIVLVSFLIVHLLAVIMSIDLNLLMNNQKSIAQGGFQIAKKYSKNIAIIALIIFPAYGTFFEEFIFRGLILRKLINYNFILANIIQASIFGFLHLFGSLFLDISMKYKIFLFIYPTLIALFFGFVYKKNNNNLLVTWLAHYLVNTFSWIYFLLTAKMI